MSFSKESSRLRQAPDQKEEPMYNAFAEKLPFTMLDVLDKNMLQYNRNSVSKEMQIECPFCGKKKFYVNTVKNTAHCFCCDWSGGILQLDAAINNYDTKEAYRALEKELGLPDLTREERFRKMDERRKEIEAKQIEQKNLRSVDDRNRTYTALSRLIRLADDHRQDLIRRGLSQVAIERNGYRSYPQEMRDELAVQLQQDGMYVDGIPGFFVNDKNMWTMMKLKRGFMCPVRNHEGKIQGYQVRKDDRLLKVFEKTDANGNRVTEKENKFVWMSSKNELDGCGAPGSVHYACDFRNGRAVIGKTVYLTEGPLKGDIAHYISSKPFICVPGVNLQNALADELERLRKDYGVENIVVCYDMDYLTNPNVKGAMEKCYDLIRGKGLNPYRAVWNTDYKGIDDYLVAVTRK